MTFNKFLLVDVLTFNKFLLVDVLVTHSNYVSTTETTSNYANFLL